MKFNYDSRLLPLLTEIEGYLIANTPEVIAKLKFAEPAYAVFLWYDDSSTTPDARHGVRRVPRPTR